MFGHHRIGTSGVDLSLVEDSLPPPVDITQRVRVPQDGQLKRNTGSEATQLEDRHQPDPTRLSGSRHHSTRSESRKWKFECSF